MILNTTSKRERGEDEGGWVGEGRSVLIEGGGVRRPIAYGSV